MVIKAWSENIHEPQIGEVSREWCYLHPFYIFPGNIREYVEFLDYAFKKIVLKNCQDTVSKYEDILHRVYKDNFEFDSHDVSNGFAPGDIVYQWSAGRNCKAEVKYTWKERRTSFRKEVFSDRKEDVKLIVADAIIGLTNDTVYLAKQNKKVVQKEVMNGSYSPNKSESAAKAGKNIVETLFQLIGEDTTNIKAEVVADVDATAEVNNTSNVKLDPKAIADRDLELMEKFMESKE